MPSALLGITRRFRAQSAGSTVGGGGVTAILVISTGYAAHIYLSVHLITGGSHIYSITV